MVRGSAVNHVGASVGLTVPDGPAQEQVIEDALLQAGLAPAEVDYLEAHGTGTEVGGSHRAGSGGGRVRPGASDPERPLLIGSVKTNMGHLEPAAGIAGLIKTVLAMRREWVPKHLHFNNPNPARGLAADTAARRRPRPRAGRAIPAGRRVRGVSAYGMSGTNAHVVVEGYGEPPRRGGRAWSTGCPAPRCGCRRPSRSRPRK